MFTKFAKVFKVVLFMITGAVTFNQANEDAVTSKVMCETTKGDFVIDVYRAWAPIGADHFIDLVKNNFYTDIAFFRCVEGFLTQFGISDKEDMQHWHNENIPDDINKQKGIEKNYISFAGGGENTRSTQLFIAFEYLDFLGKEPWEVLICIMYHYMYR
jgi:peptidyl-prolyl cis-trans isomerase A (cyclophilin A)